MWRCDVGGGSLLACEPSDSLPGPYPWRSPASCNSGWTPAARHSWSTEATLDALLSLQTPRTNSELRRIAPSLPPTGWIPFFTTGRLRRAGDRCGAAAGPGADRRIGCPRCRGVPTALLTSRASGCGPPVPNRRPAPDSVSGGVGGGTRAARPHTPDPSTIEHDRALSDMLVAEGLDHLVVRSEPDRAVVGPFTVGGRFPVFALPGHAQTRC